MQFVMQSLRSELLQKEKEKEKEKETETETETETEMRCDASQTGTARTN